MEIYIMIIMFYIVMFLALIAFFKNRVTPKSKIEDLEKRVAQLEKENIKLKNRNWPTAIQSNVC